MSTMHKIPVTQKQRRNQLEAKLMMSTVPPENIIPDLRTWRAPLRGQRLSTRWQDKPPSCNTVACFGGWCAWWPAFRAQGVTSSYGAPVMQLEQHEYGHLYSLPPEDVSFKLFGHEEMFDQRDYGPGDGYAPENLTDHQLVMHRIQWLIEHSEVVE